MAHPATQASATRRWHHPGAPPPEGAAANVRRGDTASVLPPRPHGWAMPPRDHPAARELIDAGDIGDLARRVAEAKERHSP